MLFRSGRKESDTTEQLNCDPRTDPPALGGQESRLQVKSPSDHWRGCEVVGSSRVSPGPSMGGEGRGVDGGRACSHAGRMHWTLPLLQGALNRARSGETLPGGILVLDEQRGLVRQLLWRKLRRRRARGVHVGGLQGPERGRERRLPPGPGSRLLRAPRAPRVHRLEIERASCRERV